MALDLALVVVVEVVVHHPLLEVAQAAQEGAEGLCELRVCEQAVAEEDEKD